MTELVSYVYCASVCDGGEMRARVMSVVMRLAVADNEVVVCWRKGQSAPSH
jgi:hypothetical protein